MIRILNAEPIGYSDDARHILSALGSLEETDCLSRESLLRALPDVQVLIVRFRHFIDREVLEASGRLRAIVTATTGLDHIDTTATEALGIRVLSLRGEREFLDTIAATAEFTWTLVQALVRRLPEAQAQIVGRSFDRYAVRGNDLAGKSLGILGFGRVGGQVAKYAQAFGMSVGVYDPAVHVAPAGVRRFPSPEELVEWSQILSVHLPLNQTTAGMLSRKLLQRLPSGAWLVNTARGALLDETALLELLESGHLSGAALDVLQDEFTLGTTPERSLIRYADTHPNLILTPHVGGATVESMRRAEVFMAKKLESFCHSPGVGESTPETAR